MKPPLLTRLAAALLLLAAAACGKATSPISSVLSFTGDDVAGTTPVDLAYNSVDRDLQASDSLGHGPCGAVGFPLGIPAGCPYDAASTSFVCGPEILRDGLTRTFSYQFLDASGAPQSAYDAIATASIHFTSHIGGTSRRRGRTSVVDDHRDLTLSGLAGTETTRIWNGTGNSSRQDSVSTDSGTVIINLASTTTVANVVVPAPWARDSWPLSGTVTSHLVTSRGIDQTAVITFNGTRFVPLTIGGTTVTIDLARWLRGGPGGPIGGGPMAGGRAAGTESAASRWSAGRHARGVQLGRVREAVRRAGRPGITQLWREPLPVLACPRSAAESHGAKNLGVPKRLRVGSRNRTGLAPPARGAGPLRPRLPRTPGGTS